MKYGRAFQAQSAPQWAPYNIDYDELKNLIKANTTKNQGQAIAIPGQGDTALQKFEAVFFEELTNQHDRVDLFVKSKADEIGRRLQFLQKSVLRLLARSTYNNGKPISQKRKDRFTKYDGLITRCGSDIQLLDRFVDAQRVAFHKILKKYKKWTGSSSLGDRFRDDILGNPKSFTRRDFGSLMSQYSDLLMTLRASTPMSSEESTPRPSRRPSTHVQAQQAPQGYWNEYDDGDEAQEDEPYTIMINPDAEATYPGARTIAYVVSRAKIPMEKVKGWLSPKSEAHERQSLLGNSYFPENRCGSATDTDGDDDAYASSSDFPIGYTAHYATFPSVSDQKLSQYRETLLFRGTIASFLAAILLLAVAGILVLTGKHKLRIEVDAGVLVGVVASLFFATLGIGMMLYRKQQLGWFHRVSVSLTFVTVCVLNGMLLVLMVSQ
ncbi:spx domain-containing protein [Phlyctema vagabunda]|uniref:Spx domain-containing protein n=1 Tax=Phlyctema vagabunda TaxID=108571 RepID=A0ABR4PMQ5_9HELO